MQESMQSVRNPSPLAMSIVSALVVGAGLMAEVSMGPTAKTQGSYDTRRSPTRRSVTGTAPMAGRISHFVHQVCSLR